MAQEDDNEKRVKFSLRISPAFHAKLIDLAKRDRRKLNDQILWMLERQYKALTGDDAEDTQQPP